MLKFICLSICLSTMSFQAFAKLTENELIATEFRKLYVQNAVVTDPKGKSCRLNSNSGDSSLGVCDPETKRKAMDMYGSAKNGTKTAALGHVAAGVVCAASAAGVAFLTAGNSGGDAAGHTIFGGVAGGAGSGILVGTIEINQGLAEIARTGMLTRTGILSRIVASTGIGVVCGAAAGAASYTVKYLMGIEETPNGDSKKGDH